MPDTTGYDYIIIGGGLAGCTPASRLHEKHPALSILLIEAGPDVTNHPLTQSPLACFGAHHSPLDWAYTTVPQVHLDNRQCYNSAGRALGGGSATNYGTWTRGNAADYDRWGEIVEDKSWGYGGLLPYFKKTETHCHGDDSSVHGTTGPIHNVSVSASSPERKSPLREPLEAAWNRLGVESIRDMNGGSPMGLGELVENWRQRKRQIASEAYGISDLPGVDILTEAMVQRVLIQEGEKVASKGVGIVGGRVFHARKEVIVSAGVYRTPQVLMLSGIGPLGELAKHGIKSTIDAPEVGRNFHDHFAFVLRWKLRHPENGLSIGTPLWNRSAYGLGLPCDWVATVQAPRGELVDALKRDGETNLEEHPHLAPDACHIETLIVYAPAGAAISGVEIPMDGAHIASAVLGMAPTSRGSITLAPADATTPLLIDLNYYTTDG